MTKITLTDGHLTVEGHANYGEAGKDIVCAAVSTLTFTLLGSVETTESTFADGYVDAYYKPNNAVTEAVRNGFMMLAETYPDYVSVGG